MSGFTIVAEGPIETARLSLNHLHTRPQTGPAPKALLLGGSNFDLQLKRGFLQSALPTWFELATYEPRGIGRTEQPPGAWTMADYAEDARALLDALGWDRTIVIGESFGGMTALHLALLAPERISCMVLASATAGGTGGASYDISEFLDLPREVAARKALILQDSRNLARAEADPAAFAEALQARIAFETAFARSSVDNGGYARLLRARRDHDVWADLPGIPTPTLVVAGAYDDQAPLMAQRSMCARLPAGEFRAFDGGHGLLFSEPKVLPWIYREWLTHQIDTAAGNALAV